MKLLAGLAMLLVLTGVLPVQAAGQKQYVFAVLPQRPPVTMCNAPNGLRNSDRW